MCTAASTKTSTIPTTIRPHLALFSSQEPGLHHNQSLQGRFVDLLPPLLHLIGSAQPSRVMVAAAEIGWRPDAASKEFVNAAPALVMDGHTLANLATRHHLVATFHFYRPRAFTNQGTPEVAVPQPRWLGNASDLDDLESQFAAVRSVLKTTPIYLGEFGLNVELVPVRADGVAWLRAVRALAERYGFAWASWTYVLSPKGLTAGANGKEMSASERLRAWDCSEFVAALFESGRASACPLGRSLAAERLDRALRDRDGIKRTCDDSRPLWAVQLLAANQTR